MYGSEFETMLSSSPLTCANVIAHSGTPQFGATCLQTWFFPRFPHCEIRFMSWISMVSPQAMATQAVAGNEIYLGVDLSGGNRTLPENAGHLLLRRARE